MRYWFLTCSTWDCARFTVAFSMTASINTERGGRSKPSHVKAIRGGTDGAQLSFKGLPCPNIFAGGLNFHGRYEFVPIQNMEKAMKVIVKIAELVAIK